MAASWKEAFSPQAFIAALRYSGEMESGSTNLSPRFSSIAWKTAIVPRMNSNATLRR